MAHKADGILMQNVTLEHRKAEAPLYPLGIAAPGVMDGYVWEYMRSTRKSVQ